MRVKVYFCREPDVQSALLSNNKLSKQALHTIYDLVWETEFKNILNVGSGLNSPMSKNLSEYNFGKKEVIARLLPEISYK
jgi:hypothetical protein